MIIVSVHDALHSNLMKIAYHLKSSMMHCIVIFFSLKNLQSFLLKREFHIQYTEMLSVFRAPDTSLDSLVHFWLSCTCAVSFSNATSLLDLKLKPVVLEKQVFEHCM